MKGAACPTCCPPASPPSDEASKNSSASSSDEEPKPTAPNAAQEPALPSQVASSQATPATANGAHSPYFNTVPRPKKGRKVRFGSVTTDADIDNCNNCGLAVPQDLSRRLPSGAPGSPKPNGKGRNGYPVLRSTQTVIAQGAVCSANHQEVKKKDTESAESQEKEDETKEDEVQPTDVKLTLENDVDSAEASPVQMPNATHTHTVTYVTTHHPASPSTYTVLRRVCIRTLSLIYLPEGCASGPLYFGDPNTGYTIAYVFRVPDPLARGARKTYALIALVGRDSWKIQNLIISIMKTFESLANQIVAMAEEELERNPASQVNSRPSTATVVTPPLGSPIRVPATTEVDRENNVAGGSPDNQKAKSPPAPTSPIVGSAKTLTDVSSFLTAKKVDPDGYPRTSSKETGKGLAEIVGNDSFFLELHAQFCMILSAVLREVMHS